MLLVDAPLAALEDLEPDPSDTARNELIAALNHRDRPLYGGQVITLGKFQVSRAVNTGSTQQGQSLKHQSSGGVVEASHGTLGVLLEDAADPHVGYAVTALHVLENFAQGVLNRSVELGDPVFQYRADIPRLPKSADHIGWVIAVAPALDAALIGLRPNRTWRPEVLVEPGTAVLTKRGDFVFPSYADPSHSTASPANSHRWGPDFSRPNRTDLPTTGPVVSKTGSRTGHTTGWLYWLAHPRKDPPFADQIAQPRAGSSDPRGAWDEMVRFYAGVVDDKDLPLALDDDKFNPPRYLCVPDPTEIGPGKVSFAQKGDSGAAVLDADHRVLGLLCTSFVETAAPPSPSSWVGAAVVPIQIVIAALQDDFRQTSGSGKPGVPWPELRVPDAADIPPQPLDRRVPGGPVSPSSNPGWMQIIEHTGVELPTSEAA